MKKTAYIALAMLMIFLSASKVQAAEGSKAIALAMKVEGNVELIRDGKKSKLKFGTVLHHEDIVQTGKKGFVNLIFTDDKSIIKLTENTKVTVQGERSDDGNIKKRVSMEIGNLYAKVKKQRGTLEIATPTSVASVKGTEFWIAVDEFGKTHIVTIEGLVEFMDTNSGQIVQVRAGNKAELDEDGNLIVNPIPADEIPEDPDPDAEEPEGASRIIGIDFGNYDGDVRTIRVQFEEPAPENGEGGDE